MTDKPKRLVRGSIRAFKDSSFYDERDVIQMNVSYEDLNVVWHVPNVPKGLNEIFIKAGITCESDSQNKCRLNQVIDGLNIDSIVSEDDEYLRLKFSGLTKSALEVKLKNATEWLKQRNIPYGESDGKIACIFKCLTSEQLELGEL